MVALKPMLMYKEMLNASAGLDDTVGTVKYATMVLVEDKSQQGILSPYIATLLGHGTSNDDLLGLLAKIYDLGSPEDLLLIGRSAKECGALDFALLVAGMAAEIIKN